MILWFICRRKKIPVKVTLNYCWFHSFEENIFALQIGAVLLICNWYSIPEQSEQGAWIFIIYIYMMYWRKWHNINTNSSTYSYIGPYQFATLNTYYRGKTYYDIIDIILLGKYSIQWTWLFFIPEFGWALSSLVSQTCWGQFAALLFCYSCHRQKPLSFHEYSCRCK